MSRRTHSWPAQTPHGRTLAVTKAQRLARIGRSIGEPLATVDVDGYTIDVASLPGTRTEEREHAAVEARGGFMR